jgi:hypothetical protein
MFSLVSKMSYTRPEVFWRSESILIPFLWSGKLSGSIALRGIAEGLIGVVYKAKNTRLRRTGELHSLIVLMHWENFIERVFEGIHMNHPSENRGMEISASRYTRFLRNDRSL